MWLLCAASHQAVLVVCLQKEAGVLRAAAASPHVLDVLDEGWLVPGTADRGGAQQLPIEQLQAAGLPCLLLPLACHGELLEHAQQHLLSEAVVWQLTGHVLRGICALHERSILHRDLRVGAAHAELKGVPQLPLVQHRCLLLRHSTCWCCLRCPAATAQQPLPSSHCPAATAQQPLPSSHCPAATALQPLPRPAPCF
jgi:hypothetical protein